jgi:hypothetical protein
MKYEVTLTEVWIRVRFRDFLEAFIRNSIIHPVDQPDITHLLINSYIQSVMKPDSHSASRCIRMHYRAILKKIRDNFTRTGYSNELT